MASCKCKRGAGCTCITTVDQKIKYYGEQASSKEYDSPLITYVDEIKLDSDDLKDRYDWALDKYNSYLIMEKLLKGDKSPETNLIGTIAVMYAAEILGKMGLGVLANDLNTFSEPAVKKKLWSDRLLKVSSAKGSLSRKDEQSERSILVKEGIRQALIESNDKSLKFKAILQILEKNKVLQCSVLETRTVFIDKNDNQFSERTIRRIFDSLKTEL